MFKYIKNIFKYIYIYSYIQNFLPSNRINNFCVKGDTSYVWMKARKKR